MDKPKGIHEITKRQIENVFIESSKRFHEYKQQIEGQYRELNQKTKPLADAIKNEFAFQNEKSFEIVCANLEMLRDEEIDAALDEVFSRQGKWVEAGYREWRQYGAHRPASQAMEHMGKAFTQGLQADQKDKARKLRDDITAERLRQRAKRGRITLKAVMFVDIVGSSPTTSGMPSPQVLEYLNSVMAIVKDEMSRHNGILVKTMGDGCLVTFESAAAAINAGLAIIESLRRNNAEPTAANKPEVRIGINTGDVIMDGIDPQGMTVNIAKRIEEQYGQAMRVVVSECVRQNAVLNDVEGVFIPLGDGTPKELNGIPEPIKLFTVEPRNRSGN